ncbi:MAG: MOSC domain-containing protein [Candidatus Dormibacteria bacterium]
MRGVLVSVNVGRPVPLPYRGEEVASAIYKLPVEGRVAARGVNLEGDDQADRRVHGGPDKAVYAYALEDLEWWAAELGQPVPPGTMGENLSTAGLSLGDAVIGERWEIGNVVLEVAQPRMPCYKLGIRMGSQAFVSRFGEAARPGAYLRIIDEGTLGSGDMVRVVGVPGHRVTIGDVYRAYYLKQGNGARLAAATQLPAKMLEWAREQSPA